MYIRKMLLAAVVFTIASLFAVSASINPDLLDFLAAESEAAEIQVYPQETIGLLSAELSGHSINAPQGRLWDLGTGELRASTKDYLSRMNIKNLRWPGGIWIRRLTWAEMIGPDSIRSPLHFNVGASENRKLIFGIDELVREGRGLNPNMSFTIGVNTEHPSAEAADLVEYANSPATNCPTFDPNAWLHGQATGLAGYQPGSMPDGYYACLRAHPDYGDSTEPYAIKYWEIGNEDYAQYSGTGPALTKEQYAAKVVDFSAKMKAEDPSIQVGAVLFPNPTSDWNTHMYALPAGVADFFIPHVYSSAGLNSTRILSNYNINPPLTISEEKDYELVITATGDRGNTVNPENTCPWPDMRVKVGSLAPQTFSVNSAEPQVFTYSLGQTSPSTPPFEIGMTNDCNQQASGGDTNLTINGVRLKEPGPTFGSGQVVNLISQADLARVHTEAGYRLIEAYAAQARSGLGLGPNDPVPLFITEYASHIDTGNSSGEAYLNFGIIGAFYNATLVNQSMQKKYTGIQHWNLQERCGICGFNLIFYDGDPAPGSINAYQDGNGNPFGTANYWLYRQLSDEGELTKLRTDVVDPVTFVPPIYGTRSPVATPEVQSWSVKRPDGSVRVHVIYVGDEELDLRIKLNGYQAQSEVDVAQLRAPGGDLTAINTAASQSNITSLLGRVAGGTDSRYVVAPLTITSFTFYEPGAPPPPPPPPPPPGGGEVGVQGGGQSGGGDGGTSGGTTTKRNVGQGSSSTTQQPPVTEITAAEQSTQAIDPTVTSLDLVLPEDIPQVLARKRSILDYPYLWPTVAATTGAIAMSIWISILIRQITAAQRRHSHSFY